MAKTTIGDFIVAIVGSTEIGRITRSLHDIARALHTSSNPRFKASAKELDLTVGRLLDAVGMEEVVTATGVQVVPKPDTEPKARLHIVGEFSKANSGAIEERESDGTPELLELLPEEAYAPDATPLEVVPDKEDERGQ